jgi:hypothetical protein
MALRQNTKSVLSWNVKVIIQDVPQKSHLYIEITLLLLISGYCTSGN